VSIERVHLDTTNQHDKALDFIARVMYPFKLDSSFILEDKTDADDRIDCWNELLNDTLNFTNEELLYLKNKKYYTKEKWTHIDFPNVKIVESDKIDSIFKNSRKAWDIIYDSIGSPLRSISYPIFLRNGKYCILYISHHCGWKCGSGKLSLYKFDDGVWVKIKSYCEWIS
jgi:hypothetical protein